jgi:hypothetical protein
MAHTHDREALSLADAVHDLLEECRMVLPGVQALFGFQLIAVFSDGFATRLTRSEQGLHLLALTLVAVAGALIMTPAAYHRQTGPREATGRFLVLGGQLLLGSMVPLMLGVGLDVYLIARVILGTRAFALVLAALLVACFAHCWFLWPRLAVAKGIR